MRSFMHPLVCVLCIGSLFLLALFSLLPDTAVDSCHVVNASICFRMLSNNAY